MSVPEGVTKLAQEEFIYGEHELQHVTVIHPFASDTTKKKGLWVIYIHGGAWRDPKVTDKSILPTIQNLVSDPDHKDLINDNVAAFASISYRLSAHSSFPQDAATTPPHQLNNATHPDHLLDVLSSINFLQSKYGFGSKYILVGHSCGATLALQVIMRHRILSQHKNPDIVNPEAVVGVAGIYDIRLLRDCHAHILVPSYHEFTVAAFGSNETVWDAVSPTNFEFYGEDWPEAKLLALVSSQGDTLVDAKQIESMILRSRDIGDYGVKIVVISDLKEGHNDIWAKATEMTRVISTTIKGYMATLMA